MRDEPGGWTREKIEATMNGSKTQRVNLQRPIRVLILYGTALATEAGPVLFFDDLYGLDKKLEQQLGLAPAK
jgi:murein L,D-transpeptidase YcbB/YkuD